MPTPKIAILTPWFLSNGGGTRVVSFMAKMYPDADIFGLFARPQGIPDDLKDRQIKVSFMDRIPRIDRIYRQMLPLYPYAVESLDFSNYDLVISADATVMKGAIVGQHTKHICYCHTPMRFVWDSYRDFEKKTNWLTLPAYRVIAKSIRSWDYLAAQRVDAILANSKFIQKRIWQYYRREAILMYPPVHTGPGVQPFTPEDFYLSVGRLTHTKHLELLVEACNKLGRKLVITGVGSEEKRLKKMAGKTIEFTGRVPEKDLGALYAKCRAFLFAAEEDFGLSVVEAQSYGRPVVALGRGGVLETVLDGSDGNLPTGVFFPDQTAESLMDGILRFEAMEHEFVPGKIAANAQRFSPEVFADNFSRLVDQILQS